MAVVLLAPALLWALGCGFPSYYPNPTVYTLPDTGDSAPVDDTLPCGSPSPTDTMELQLVSYSAEERVLFERDAACAERALQPVRPSEWITRPVTPGGVYVLRESSGVLAAWAQMPYGQPVYEWSVP